MRFLEIYTLLLRLTFVEGYLHRNRSLNKARVLNGERGSRSSSFTTTIKMDEFIQSVPASYMS